MSGQGRAAKVLVGLPELTCFRFHLLAANLTNEMLSVRTWLNETCGIPYEAMKGFRSPYLVANPTERSVCGWCVMMHNHNRKPGWRFQV